MYKKLLAALGLGLLAITLVPSVSYAGLGDTDWQSLEQNLCNTKGLFDPGCIALKDKSALFQTLFGLLALVRILFWVVAVAMLLYAAYLYLFAGATGGKTDQAKTVIRYAIIAMIVAMIATSIPYLVKSILS